MPLDLDSSQPAGAIVPVTDAELLAFDAPQSSSSSIVPVGEPEPRAADVDREPEGQPVTKFVDHSFLDDDDLFDADMEAEFLQNLMDGKASRSDNVLL